MKQEKPQQESGKIEDTLRKGKELEKKMTPGEKELFEYLKSAIGKEVKPSDYDFNKFTTQLWSYEFDFWNEIVSDAEIQKFAVMTQDFNKLYFDDNYAKNSRWKGKIAPPMFLIAIDSGLKANMSFPIYIAKNKDKIPNYRGSLQAKLEFEFFEALRPGDTITTKPLITNVYWKHGNTYRMLIADSETTYFNQQNKIVARCTGGDLHLFA